MAPSKMTPRLQKLLARTVNVKRDKFINANKIQAEERISK
jgi:hypothetical protein